MSRDNLNEAMSRVVLDPAASEPRNQQNNGITPTMVYRLFVPDGCNRRSRRARKGDPAKVLVLEEEWNDAYKRSDIVAFNTLLADDFIITVEDGGTYSKAGYIAHLGSPTEGVEVSEMSDVKVRLHPNVAIVTGTYQEVGTSKRKPYEYHDRFTDVWMHGEAAWKLIASHYGIPAK
jgi:ketosteroid isomerase-like protein